MILLADDAPLGELDHWEAQIRLGLPTLLFQSDWVERETFERPLTLCVGHADQVTLSPYAVLWFPLVWFSSLGVWHAHPLRTACAMGYGITSLDALPLLGVPGKIKERGNGRIWVSAQKRSGEPADRPDWDQVHTKLLFPHQ